MLRKLNRLLNDRARRFRALIQSLKDQIDHHSRGLEEDELGEMKRRLIRQLAYSIDPASRHSNRKNLFEHQKYQRFINYISYNNTF